MNKFIKRKLSFFLFALLFYITTLFFWGRYIPAQYKPNLNYAIGAYGHLFSRLKEVKTTQNVDILFLGSSHAYRGFDTRVFQKEGFKVFNLGSSSQTPSQTLVLLKRHLSTLNPKQVILEVYPETLSSDGVESSLDLIANEKNDAHSLKMVLGVNHVKVYNSFLYALMQEALGANQSFTEPLKKGDDTYVSGGFVEKKMAYYKPDSISKNTIKLKDKQVIAFEQLLQMLKDKNIPVILVYAPIPPTCYAAYTNNKYFDSLMSKYATYYNFNNRMQLNDSLHFYDGNHLNQVGVELFNKKLIEVISGKPKEVSLP